MIRHDRHILALLLGSALDDVMGFLDAVDHARVLAYEQKFHGAYRAKLDELEAKARLALEQAGGDRKTLAVTVLPKMALPKEEWAFMFNAANGRDMNEMLMAYVQGKLGATVRYNEMAQFIGLDAQAEEDEVVGDE